MTDRQLRSLGKVDLLKLLRDQALEIEQLMQQVAQLEQQVADRRLAQENAGSIAVAALQVNHIFKVAQESADQYLYNIRQMEARCKAEVETALARARATADEVVRAAEHKAAERELHEKRYVEALWADLHEKLLRFSHSYSELGVVLKKISARPAMEAPHEIVAELPHG